jgi:hypothetical protein
MTPAASELLCPACIRELRITMLAYVAAIVPDDQRGACVRCDRPITPSVPPQNARKPPH